MNAGIRPFESESTCQQVVSYSSEVMEKREQNEQLPQPQAPTCSGKLVLASYEKRRNRPSFRRISRRKAGQSSGLSRRNSLRIPCELRLGLEESRTCLGREAGSLTNPRKVSRFSATRKKVLTSYALEPHLQAESAHDLTSWRPALTLSAIQPTATVNAGQRALLVLRTLAFSAYIHTAHCEKETVHQLSFP